MFSEELGGNTNRRRQEEQRRRRRQLKQQQTKKDADKTQAKAIPGQAEEKLVVPKTEPALDISFESADSKSLAVSNALQLRAERQEKQKQEKSARKIQAFYRSHRSNSILLKNQSDALEKHLRDLTKLNLLLKEKANTDSYVFPPATATALCQKLLLLSITLPYKQRDRLIKLRDAKSRAQSLQLVLELVILPGIRGKEEKSNPLLLWIQSLQGQLRLQNLIRLCLCVMTSSSDENVLKTCSDFILSVTLPSNNPNVHPLILRACRSLLLPPSQPQIVNPTVPKTGAKKKPLFFARIGSPLDLISVLRQQLLFATGGSPIPSNSDEFRETCIPSNERQIAGSLFRTVLEAAEKTSDTTERNLLLLRVFAEIFTVPLLTWRVSTDSLLSRDHVQPSKLIVVSMIEVFTHRFGDTLNTGDIQSILPNDISLSICNATPAQCLLANLVQIGQASASLSGQVVAKLDFALSATFYEFIATLVDAIPLGTLTTKDSVVEWFSDRKGHQTCVRLSPIIMEHCRLLVSSSSVRRLFHCAIDQSVLKTKETLQSKTDRDLKQEKEFEEAGVSAVSLAAKEARIDRSKTFWNSSSWARKVSSGVSKMLSGDSTSAETPSLIKNPSSPRPDKASGSSSTESKRTSYSSDLFMVLCRLYGIVLARWGGFGGEDVVRRVQSYSTKIQKNEATRTADVCSQSLLNVLCFSTSIVQASWGLIQAEKGLSSSANAVIHPTKEKLPVRCLSIRPRYGNGKKDQTKNDALALLFVFVSALAHTLIVTDDTEIHDMEKPLPLHQLRRCVETLKQLLYRACWVDAAENASASVFESNYFGLALINSSARTMRDLYDRSSRRPISTTKLWLIEDLLEKEIRKSKTEDDYAKLLKTPVLRMCPFLVSFKRRLKLFDRIICKNRILIQGENSTNPFNTNPLKPGIPVRITRGRILEDGLKTMNNLGTNMRQRIAVQYHNEAGTRESGVDAGGLFKEFWTDLSAIAFDPNYALFRMTEDNRMYPSPASSAAHGLDHIVLFEFLGRILGKALYEGITIQPQFAHFFVSFLRGDYNYFHMLSDLSTIDKQLYNNVMFLKTYENDAEDLFLTFTVGNNDFGQNNEINLIPNGSEVPVTNENKQRYIGLVAKYYVVDRLRDQCEAFTRGLWEVIDPSWLRIFNEPELQVLIGGPSDGKIDVDDLRANCRYAGGFTGIDPTVNRFWKAVASFTPAEQAHLLRFVTSCERPPPLGFSSMNPPFTIQRVGILRDGDRLPTASTCFNVLKLPTYSSQKVIRERLLYAIHSGAGFELI